MRLIRGLALVCALVLCASAYIALPFYTAWSIREAVKANDAAYLTDKVEWATVRETLKVSLVSFPTDGTESSAAAKPGLWQRIRAYVNQTTVATVVDTTVTPTGIGGLLGLRRTYQGVTGEDPNHGRPFLARLQHVWAKVTRAEFKSLNRFEMDMLDADPTRIVSAVLERRGLEWKMTELRLKPTPAGFKLPVAAL